MQNTMTAKLATLDGKTTRVVTANRQRNILMGNSAAYHVVVAPDEYPEMLVGIVFESIEVSPMLKGREPAWVANFLAINQMKLDGKHCSYPRCNCPADHPGTEGWCMRGLPTGGES